MQPIKSDHPLVRASRLPPARSGNADASNPLPPAPHVKTECPNPPLGHLACLSSKHKKK